MRVVRSSVYRRYTSSLNDLQSNLNKSMNKVSTGAAYETAADNPLAYYQGKKMDHLYQDAKSKSSILGDIKNRLYQQEQGARDIQKTLSNSKTSMQYLLDSSHNSSKTSVQTKRDALLQDVQSMVSNLNTQYQDFYVYGGNDITTAPFSLSGDGKTLTYTHVYSDGKTKTVNMTMAYNKDTNTYSYDLKPEDLNNLVTAMREQGRVDIGYGDISNRQSLLDTYTGGLNMLTGLTSDSLNGADGMLCISCIFKYTAHSICKLINGRSIIGIIITGHNRTAQKCHRSCFQGSFDRFLCIRIRHGI